VALLLVLAIYLFVKSVRGSKKEGIPLSINVTPLIDVLLVLLIAFMVVTPMLQKGVNFANVDTPNPQDSSAFIDKALSAAIQHLSTGKVAFNVPDHMTQGVAQEIQVRVSRDIKYDIGQGLKELLGDGTIVVEDIKVGPLMSVKLNGSHFEILELTQVEQVVPENTFATWVWEVRPMDWGTQTLFVTVGVRLRLSAGKDEVRFAPVYKRDIKVRVNPPFEAVHFAKAHWEWVWGSVLVPVWIVWKRYRKKRKAEKKNTILLP
jgi:biopolymer transport protein ExbD